MAYSPNFQKDFQRLVADNLLLGQEVRRLREENDYLRSRLEDAAAEAAAFVDTTPDGSNE